MKSNTTTTATNECEGKKFFIEFLWKTRKMPKCDEKRKSDRGMNSVNFKSTNLPPFMAGEKKKKNKVSKLNFKYCVNKHKLCKSVCHSINK